MSVASTTSTDGSLTVTSQPTTSSTGNSTLSSDTFLKLLVAQMQNQDPLNPMDNAQVTSQLAQINTVSGIQQLNTTVGGLSTQFTQLQAVQGASLVGRDVIVAGNKLSIDSTSGDGQGGFKLDNAADAVKVEVLSPAGVVVQTMNLGAESAGMHSFDWTGAGTAAAGGNLTFRVTATTGGVATAATTLMRDKVDAVSSDGTTFNLELENSGTVPYTSIVAFN